MQIYGLPRLFLLSLGFTLLLFFLVRLRLSLKALAFIAAYLAGMAIGSAMAYADRRLEVPSSLQLLAALGTFAVTATFVEDWMGRYDDSAKAKAIEWVLWFFLLLSFADIVLYKYFGYLRDLYYEYPIIQSIDRTYRRDITLYFLPRPVCFFSEASNFARFIGILVSYHAYVSKFSKRSIAWLAIFQVVTRSPSMLFALPILAIALVRSISALPGARAGLKKNRLPIVIGAILALVLMFGASQIGRLGGGAGTGSDGSLASRLGTPVEYMVDVWEHPYLGSGLTPQDEVQEFVLVTEIHKGRAYLGEIEGYREGIAPTILCIIGMGLLGMIVFAGMAASLLGRIGLLVAASFLFANFLASGYNSASMFVPWAMIYPLLLMPAEPGSRSPVPRRPATKARAMRPSMRAG